MSKEMIQDQEIKNIFYKELQLDVISIKRLLTGYCHYVFRVETVSDLYILRVSKSETVELLKGASFWLHYLQNKNIAIPKIIVDGIDMIPPYLVFNYFEGDDLGNVYDSLSTLQKMQIAKHVVKAQKTVQTLPMHKGYGYLASYDDVSFEKSWKQVIFNHLKRSKERFQSNRVFDMYYIEKVENLVTKYDDYFNNVLPVPFLDDATTKNVIIHNGEFQGIVDIDFLCFGDYLLNVGLINMALLSSGSDTDYVNYIMDEYSLNEEQHRIIDLYTLIYCVDFMSEIGMTFNRDEAISAPSEKIELYKQMFIDLYNKVS